MISCSFPIIKSDFNCGNKPCAINADMVIMDLSRSYSLFSLLQTSPNKTSSLGSANFGANFPKLSLPAVCLFIIITITFQAANILLKIINASLQPDKVLMVIISLYIVYDTAFFYNFVNGFLDFCFCCPEILFASERIKLFNMIKSIFI